jgi:hypothetical protein
MTTALLLLLLVPMIISFRFGILPNRMYANSNSSLVLFNQSLHNCICHAFAENTSTFVLMNFYATDNRCELFENYPAQASMLVDNDNVTIVMLPYIVPLQMDTTNGLMIEGTHHVLTFHSVEAENNCVLSDLVP